MIKALQRRFALSRQGAVDLIKGCIACVVQDISFMIPVGLLYMFVMDIMNGGVNGSRIAVYAVGILVCLCFIFVVTYFQYNATYLATYVESGVRRISLAEQLRKIPLSFFGEKRPCRFDELHHGRLRHVGNCVFPLCTRFGRLSHFHNPDCGLSFFL